MRHLKLYHCREKVNASLIQYLTMMVILDLCVSKLVHERRGHCSKLSERNSRLVALDSLAPRIP